jgi:XTP/dITP diphosphohydrolase
MDILIASRNVHKIREFREILKNLKGFEFISLMNFPHYSPPEESGTTFEENAIAKAVDAAKALNMLTLADDSGLVVPSLNNAPGVFSRRYAGIDATDAENRKKLLEALAGKHGFERAAFFECSLALANSRGLIKSVSARCEGLIALEGRGSHGFGYDPIFIKNGYDKTFAELDESIKNRMSHRRKALDKISLVLENLR